MWQDLQKDPKTVEYFKDVKVGDRLKFKDFEYLCRQTDRDMVYFGFYRNMKEISKDVVIIVSDELIKHGVYRDFGYGISFDMLEYENPYIVDLI